MRELSELKRQVYKISKTNLQFKPLFKSLDRLYSLYMRNNTKSIENKILSSKNKKCVYGYINRKLHQRNFLPLLISSSSEVMTKPQDKANVLNQHFASVFFPKDNTKNPQLLIKERLKCMKPMSPIIITPTLVFNAISKLKNSVSRTPDDIPAFFLKKVSSAISKSLSTFYNISLSQGKVPSIWKQAYVIPIFKNKGLKSDPTKFRGVSLTPNPCKVLEFIIHESTSRHLADNNIL